ncbi:MAG: hypothetical protein CMF46_02385 [Legionellales bacterium]|nr:hypothetical protein [Legionellales bacterium]
MNQNGEALQYVLPQWQDNSSIMLAALEQNIAAEKYVSAYTKAAVLFEVQGKLPLDTQRQIMAFLVGDNNEMPNLENEDKTILRRLGKLLKFDVKTQGHSNSNTQTSTAASIFSRKQMVKQVRVRNLV